MAMCGSLSILTLVTQGTHDSVDLVFASERYARSNEGRLCHVSQDLTEGCTACKVRRVTLTIDILPQTGTYVSQTC